jgi:hypothetical protein
MLGDFLISGHLLASEERLSSMDVALVPIGWLSKMRHIGFNVTLITNAAVSNSALLLMGCPINSMHLSFSHDTLPKHRVQLHSQQVPNDDCGSAQGLCYGSWPQFSAPLKRILQAYWKHCYSQQISSF